MDICIYHGNCADGFGAAYAVWKKFGTRCQYIKGVYGEDPPYIDISGKDVVIVDFSYKKDVMHEVVQTAKSVTVLDHHKTAEEELSDFFTAGTIDGVFDMERSGAVIAWQWFHPDTPIPRLFKHIQDRDLWKFELEYTKEIQAAVFSYPYSFPVWNTLVSSCEANAYDLIGEGESILRKHTKDINELLRMAEHTLTIGGHIVPALNAPYFYASEAGHIMCAERLFAACYYRTVTGWVFSLRSNDGGMDVSEIAKLYGGGGHRNAAGFRVDKLEDLYNYVKGDRNVV